MSSKASPSDRRPPVALRSRRPGQAGVGPCVITGSAKAFPCTRPTPSPRPLLAATTAATLAAGTLGTVVASAAAAGCRVDYQITNQWQGGFGANVTVTNLGDPINGWTLTWSYAAGQQVTQAWNATVTQSGAQVTAKNAGYNAAIATNGTASFGFNGSWNNAQQPGADQLRAQRHHLHRRTAPTTAPPTTAPPTTPATTAPPRPHPRRHHRRPRRRRRPAPSRWRTSTGG